MRHERLTDFLASRGFTFWKWLMARNYDLRHWSLYNEFNQLENKK